MRARLVVLSFALALVWSACQVALRIPDGKLREMAQSILAVGHPTVSFKDARVTGAAPGGCLPRTDPYVDVEITYRRALGLQDHTMVTRLTVRSAKPCKVEPQVLSDSGPVPAVLLSEALLGPALGQYLCDELSGTGEKGD